ncbi:hypothetical protein FHG87_007260 [Trinorchestia longiramus]|nr:hypothetical protein FHG87_007260 [Trinorchestia longiramus]
MCQHIFFTCFESCVKPKLLACACITHPSNPSPCPAYTTYLCLHRPPAKVSTTYLPLNCLPMMPVQLTCTTHLCNPPVPPACTTHLSNTVWFNGDPQHLPLPPLSSCYITRNCHAHSFPTENSKALQLLLVICMLVSLMKLSQASPSKKGHPKSIPHHAAHILADPNHNSPRLLTMPSAQRLTHGPFPVAHPQHLHHPHHVGVVPHNGVFNNGLHNAYAGLGYNGLGHNGLSYNNLGYNGLGFNGFGQSRPGFVGYNNLGYNPYGVQPENAYYIQLPDGRVEETSKVAAQLGYYPVARGLYDPYRG